MSKKSQITGAIVVMILYLAAAFLLKGDKRLLAIVTVLFAGLESALITGIVILNTKDR